MKREYRTRMSRGDLLVAAVILLLAGLLTVFLLPRGQQGLAVQVVRDGQVLLTRTMDSLSESETLLVDGAYPLTLELSAQGVRVTRTTCPGGDCQHMGTITKAGQQIVCLPNRLVVTLTGDAPSYDAMTG